MDSQTPLEQKREEARAYRGVTYDDRIGRFTASIMIRGQRRYLGSFLTAGEASLVYDQARRADPIERRRSGAVATIKKLMAEFADNAARNANGHVVPGQIFTAQDSQRFRFEGVEKKGKRNTFVWSSRCKICGAFYHQNSVNSFRSITGLNRTCEEHRNQLGKHDIHDWPDPPEWDEAPKIFSAKVPAKKSENAVESLDSLPPRARGYAEKLRQRKPGISLAEIKQRYNDMVREELEFNARMADTEALAAEPAKDNSDLV